MTGNGASALIVAKPGPLRDSLRALLIAMPQVDTLKEVYDLSSALRMAFECAPALVILDSGLAGTEIWLTVRQAKAKWPRARCIFLADSVQQQYEAEAAGADAVLLKRVLPSRLVAAVVRLLPRRGEKEESYAVLASPSRNRDKARRFGRQRRPYRLVL